MNKINHQRLLSQSMGWTEWGLLVFLSVLWGGSFFFNGVAVQELPVFTVVFGRVGIAAIALLLLIRMRGISFPTDPRILGSFLIMGAANNLVPFSLIVAGQTQIGSGLASILNATTPLFTAVIAHLFSNEVNERLTGHRIFGVLLGIVGVVFMIAPDIQEIGFTGSEVMGQFAILGAALSYGVALVYGRRFSKAGISPMVTATGQVSGTTLLLLPVILFVEQPWNYIGEVSFNPLISVVALALLSTVLAYIIFFKLLSSAGATNVSLVTLLVPVSAILLGVLFLGESLSLPMISGMAFIGLGLIVIDGRALSLFRRKKPGNLPG
ncbi:MAG: DMT family transporter [Sneathiella sp.]